LLTVSRSFMNIAYSVLWRMAIILKANKVNLFVCSVSFVFWYHSPKSLDTPHILRVYGSWLSRLQYSQLNEKCIILGSLYWFTWCLALGRYMLRNGWRKRSFELPVVVPSNRISHADKGQERRRCNPAGQRNEALWRQFAEIRHSTSTSTRT
jgi:hypothetical protein